METDGTQLPMVWLVVEANIRQSPHECAHNTGQAEIPQCVQECVEHQLDPLHKKPHNTLEEGCLVVQVWGDVMHQPRVQSWNPKYAAAATRTFARGGGSRP